MKSAEVINTSGPIAPGTLAAAPGTGTHGTNTHESIKIPS